jgi:hypothetical protein
MACLRLLQQNCSQLGWAHRRIAHPCSNIKVIGKREDAIKGRVAAAAQVGAGDGLAAARGVCFGWKWKSGRLSRQQVRRVANV